MNLPSANVSKHSEPLQVVETPSIFFFSNRQGSTLFSKRLALPQELESPTGGIQQAWDGNQVATKHWSDQIDTTCKKAFGYNEMKKHLNKSTQLKILGTQNQTKLSNPRLTPCLLPLWFFCVFFSDHRQVLANKKNRSPDDIRWCAFSGAFTTTFTKLCKFTSSLHTSKSSAFGVLEVKQRKLPTTFFSSSFGKSAFG